MQAVSDDDFYKIAKPTEPKFWDWKCPQCKTINRWYNSIMLAPRCGEIHELECAYCKTKIMMECKMKKVK